jgi:excisionase family DNA binding protein
MEEELLTPEESAIFLKMHIDSVRRLLRQGKLPGVKVGGAWRIPKSALSEMLTVTVKKPPAMEEKPAVRRRRRKTGKAGD